MPFTPSHIAAVLPLARTRLSLSALAIGSMAPDLPYYVPGLGHGAVRDLTHSAEGVVSIDVVLGLVAFAVWHGVLCAPGAYAMRLPADVAEIGLRRRMLPVPRTSTVLLSLAVGAATHVLWDSFTHGESWGPRHIHLLTRDVGPLVAYQWAQYASGVLGLVVVLAWSVARLRALEVPAPSRTAVILVASAAGVSLAVGLREAVARLQDHDVRGAFFAGITHGAAGGAAVLLAAALAWHLLRVRSAGPGARSGAA